MKVGHICFICFTLTFLFTTVNKYFFINNLDLKPQNFFFCYYIYFCRLLGINSSKCNFVFLWQGPLLFDLYRGVHPDRLLGSVRDSVHLSYLLCHPCHLIPDGCTTGCEQTEVKPTTERQKYVKFIVVYISKKYEKHSNLFKFKSGVARTTRYMWWIKWCS